MQRGKIRNVQILSLLCVMCHLSLAFPAFTPPTFDAGTHLQVKTPHSEVIISPLGSLVALPCFVSLSSAPSSTIDPRVKWTVVSGGTEQEIIVARGQRVKVHEAFKDRAALPNYTSSPDDLTLWLSDVRSSDSGYYRCEVQQGLEDASDLIQLKVKGVVFHYRDALGRYAFSFPQAQKACEAIGAKMATADQLIAAYYDGYEQCDAGWLADQSVRYPIQVPRAGCYGDMDGLPGVRNYGTMDPDNLYDVYCYIDHMDGEVFHDPVPQQLSFPEAQSYCKAAGAELASTAQLHLAWSEGLDRCNPGWLSDGSVRYPIITPRERCGGSQAGVKTVYRFSNQTGFPKPSSLHDVYCFRGYGNVLAASAILYMAEESEELQLHRAEHVEREALSFLESFSLFSASSTEKTPAVSNTTESSHNTTSEPDVIHLNNATATTEMTLEELEEDSLEDNNTILEDGEHNNSTEMVNSTFEKTDDETTTQDFSASLKETNNSTHNDTQHTFNSTFDRPQLASGFPENDTKNQTTVAEEYTDLAEDEEREIIHLTEMVNLTFEKEGDENTTQNDFSTSLKETNNSTHNETQHTSNSSFDRPQLENVTRLSDTKNHTEVTEEATELAEDEESLQTNTTDRSNEDGLDEGIMEETNTTSVPTLQLEEAKVSDPVEISLLTEAPEEDREDILTEPTQAFTSSTQKLTSLLSPDGSGDDSQEADLSTDATTLNLNTLSDSPTLDRTTSLVPSAPPSSTVFYSAVPNLTTSPGRDLFRQEGSTSVETEDAMMVGSEEITQLSTNPDNLLISSVSFGTTESPEVSYSSMKPNYREYLEVVTDAFQEASGDESETVMAMFDEIKPTLEDAVSPTHQDEQEGDSLEDENALIGDEENIHLKETVISTFDEDNDTTTVQDNVTPSLNVRNESKTTQETIKTTEVLTTAKLTLSPTSNKEFAFPIDSQTAHWTSLTTTTGPQESFNRLVYNRKTSTLAQDLPKTTTSRPHWTRRTSWTATTAVPEVNPETKPHTVTVHIPPVDTGRVDHEFSLTPPPTLHILPVERAAIGGTGKISDGCLNDPCLNGGTCTEQNGQIKCLCLPSYGGDLCQTDLEHCEGGWDKFQGFCYRHFGRRLSWEVAEQHCRMLGAHLVSIMSPEEQSFINNFYKEYQWTGLNDKAIENDFRWSDGNPMLYENWYRGQPDSYFLSGEDCVVMVWHDNGRWSDVPCNYHLAYTCKKGTSSCGPPPKVRNASIFGKVRQRYATNAAVRYHCAEGFRQRLNPLIRCQSGGKWERPQIRCIPENGSPTQYLDVTSPDDRNLAAVEDEYGFHEFETPKEMPQYWDIKF